MISEQNAFKHYRLNGQGGGESISWEEATKLKASEDLIWYHLDYTDPGTINWLETESGLEESIIQSLIAEETRPRCLINHDGIFVSLRGVNLNPGQDPEDMVSIRVWISQNKIITTQRRKLLSVGDLEKLILKGEGPASPIDFLIMLNKKLTDRMSDVLEDIDEQVDLLEQEVITARSYMLRTKIADVRRQAVAIRRYLAPQREALYRLQVEKSALIDDAHQVKIREINDRLIRYIEDIDSARDRANITQEELAGRLSEQMESRMYVLSIVSLIFLPLTFLSGLLGINVGGIPGTHYEGSFLIVCVVLFVVGVLTVIALKYKKWI